MRGVLVVQLGLVCGVALVAGCGGSGTSGGTGLGGTAGEAPRLGGADGGGSEGIGGTGTAGIGDGTGGAECVDGTERCPCYGNGTCNEGLVCASDICVDLGSGGQAGAGGVGIGGSAATAGVAGTPVDGGAAGIAGAAGVGDDGGTAGAAGSATAGAAGTAGTAGTGGAAGAPAAGAGGVVTAGAGGLATGGAAGSAGGVSEAGGTPGSSGSGGEGSGGEAGDAGWDGHSCASMTGTECQGESCCASIVLPSGSYLMGRGTETCTDCTDGCPAGMTCYAHEQPEHSATVSSFALDKYEVTVGRFRAFVDAGGGTQLSPPVAGSGAHPLIAGSGWDSAWDALLPADQAALMSGLACDGNVTWTDTPNTNEAYPLNCVNWYEAFAFCIWDGGRLPTEAEWEYAAAGGDENRVYPWGDDVTEPLPANYDQADRSPFVAVGSYPDGNGRWGHADLAGSMLEWVLDWYADDWYTTTQFGCADCANLATASLRMGRGGSWDYVAHPLRAAYRSLGAPTSHSDIFGFRCSRLP